MIESLTIKNFKCFVDQNVELSKLTVLAGSNGVGKSTIIQSMLLIRQTIDVMEHHFSAIIEKWIDGIIKKKETETNSAINAKILLNHEYLLQLGNSKEILNSKSKSNQISLTIKSKHGEVEFGYDASISNLSLISNVLKGDYSNDSFNIGKKTFHYLNAERLGPRNIQEITEQNFNSVGFQGEYTGQAIYKAEVINQKLEDGDKRIFEANANKSLYKISNQVELWMKFIIPEIEIRIDPFPEISSVRVSLRQGGSDTEFLHPNNIGFGITYVLPIIVSGLIAEKESMLIVENPEAHLHPSSQSRIAQFLARVASSDIQVIIETHSEHFINGIRIASLNNTIDYRDAIINFVSKTEDKEVEVKKIDLTDDGDLTSYPRGFFDQEQRDLADIVKLRRMKTNVSELPG